LQELAAGMGVLGLKPLGSPGIDAGSQSLIEAILERRRSARAARDFDLADRLRNALAEAGVAVTDGPDGQKWELRRDVVVGAPYFDRFRAAAQSGDEAQLERRRLEAAEAGIHFAGGDPATAPAWRGVPSDKHIQTVLSKALHSESLA
jgi:hypothetical protein